MTVKKAIKKDVVFFSEFDAIGFLFYLIMKRYYDIKKRWW